MVGKTGFEPATSCSQSTRSTRLNYFPNGRECRSRTHIYRFGICSSTIELTPYWVDRRESNSQPSEPQSDALPFELLSTLVGQDGLEPSIFSVSEKRFNQLIYCPMAPRAGLEPATN